MEIETSLGRHSQALTRTQNTRMEIDTLPGRHRQAKTRTQQPPMEDHDQRVPCTLVRKGDQNHEGDNPAVSRSNTSRTTDIDPQTNKTTSIQIYWDTKQPVSQPNSKRYMDFLIHQFNDTCSALRPVSTRRKSTRTHTIEQKNHRKTSIAQRSYTLSTVNPQQSKFHRKASFQTNTCQSNSLVSRLRNMFGNEHRTQHTQSARTKTHVGHKRADKKVSFFLKF